MKWFKNNFRNIITLEIFSTELEIKLKGKSITFEILQMKSEGNEEFFIHYKFRKKKMLVDINE